MDILYPTNAWGGNKQKRYRLIFVPDGPGEGGREGKNKNRHIFVTDGGFQLTF